MANRLLGVALAVIGGLVVLGVVALTAFFKLRFPNQFHLFEFHPLLDGIGILGVILLVIGLYLRRGRAQQQSSPPPQAAKG